MQATVWRRFLVVLVTFAVTAPLVVLDATRVDASDAEAATSKCKVTVSELTSNGNYVWGTSTFDCSAVPGVNAVKITGRMQERVVGVWVTRETSHSYGNQEFLYTDTLHYCNGHGTNKWRLRATGYDSTEDSKSDNSVIAKITC